MFSKWFEPWKTEPQERKSIYNRTVLQTYQGDDGSCYAHLGARLVGQNILRWQDEKKKDLHWGYRSTCRRMLNTYRPPSLTEEAKQCGEYGYLKICMFLYLYYLITERFGLEGGTIHQCLSIRPLMEEKVRPAHFTKPYDDMYATVVQFLQPPLTPFHYNYVFLDDTKSLDDPMYTSLVELLLLFLKNNMYIGSRFYMTKDESEGHLFMITGYSASEHAFRVKNTWGTFSSLLRIKEFGKPTLVFDNERIRARVNMFAFVYTRDVGIEFSHVTPEIVSLFQREFEKPLYTQPRSQPSRIPSRIQSRQSSRRPSRQPSRIPSRIQSRQSSRRPSHLTRRVPSITA